MVVFVSGLLGIVLNSAEMSTRVQISLWDGYFSLFEFSLDSEVGWIDSPYLVHI